MNNKLMAKKINDGDFLIQSMVNGNQIIADYEGMCSIFALKDRSINEDIWDYLYTPKTQREEIFHVQWHITDRCNLRCKHCYQMDYSEIIDNSYKENIQIFETLFDFTARHGKNLEISITGGEPLMDKYLFDLIEYIKNRDESIRIFLLTNGTMFTEDTYDKIITNNLTGVQISLDGSNSETHDYIRGKGSYNKSVETIKRLLSLGVYTSIHNVLQRENVHDVDNMVELCAKLGVSRLTFSRLVPIGNSETRFDSFLSANEIKDLYYHLYDLKKYYNFINLERDLWQIIDSNCGSTCPAGTSSITLLRDGTVVPCRRVPIDIGNIKEQSLDEILFYSKTVEDFERCSPLECKKCPVVDTCKGGCQAIAFAKYRTIGVKPDPQCWLYNGDNDDDDVTRTLNSYCNYIYFERKDCYVRKDDKINAENA